MRGLLTSRVSSALLRTAVSSDVYATRFTMDSITVEKIAKGLASLCECALRWVRYARPEVSDYRVRRPINWRHVILYLVGCLLHRTHQCSTRGTSENI